MADKGIAKAITMIKTEQDGGGGGGDMVRSQVSIATIEVQQRLDPQEKRNERHTHTGNENALSDPLHLVF